MMDEKEFKDLYDEYKNLVFNLSVNYIQNKEDAEDITQEVFVKIYHQWHHYNQQKSSIKTWIYRITINHCLDVIKSKKSKKRFSFITSLFNIQDEPIELPSDFYHPGIELEQKKSMQQLLNFIQQLPDNQRTAIILTKMEDRSQKEVAEIMNMTVKAVESLIQRAKQNLEKKLNQPEG